MPTSIQDETINAGLADIEARTGEPQDVMADAVLVMALVRAKIAELRDDEKRIKEVIGEIMAETGQEKWDTEAGKVYVSAPSESARYDAKALDALCASDDNVARLLAPHRKVTRRDGSLTIRTN